MRTIINAIQPRFSPTEPLLHFLGDGFKCSLREVPHGDSRLIGYHHGLEAQAMDPAYGLGDSRLQMKLRWREGRLQDPQFLVKDDFIDNAVSVEKNRPSLVRGPKRRHSFRQGSWSPPRPRETPGSFSRFGDVWPTGRRIYREPSRYQPPPRRPR